MDNSAFFILAFTSLFTVINPISTAPLFLAITTNDTKKKRMRMAFRSAVACAVVLLLFSFAGHAILTFFGITVDAFKIAGGIIITGIGFGMMKNKERHLQTEEAKAEATEKDDVSIIPLAIPILSGPGAITTTIVLMHQAAGGAQMILLSSAIIITSALAFIIFSQSSWLSRILGHNGVNVMERILGLIVLVIGIQFFINGAHGILAGWGLIAG